MNNTKKRSFTALLCVLVCTLVLALSLGILSACGGDESANVNENANEATWYYGDAEPAEGLGKEGDYYLNTETLASYVKEGKTWRAAADGEAGNWFTGDTAPTDEIGEVNDFYLDTDSGKLYHKTEGGWGSPVLILKGENGRDGVVWFSGKNADPNTYGENDTTVKDAVKGDFYLDTENFEVWQKNAEGKWDDLGSLKGKDGSMQGWYDDYSEGGSWASDKDIEQGVNVKEWWTGEGAPYDNPKMNELLETPMDKQLWGLYFDTEAGKLWRYDGKNQEVPVWTDLGNVSVGGKVLNVEYRSLQWGKEKYSRNAEKIINLFGNSTGLTHDDYDLGGVEWVHESMMGKDNVAEYEGMNKLTMYSTDRYSGHGTIYVEQYDETTGLYTEQDKDGKKVYTPNMVAVRAELNFFDEKQKSYLTEHDITEGTPVRATPENTPDGWWRPTMKESDEYLMGYWIIYEDGTAYFLPMACAHGNGYGETITLVQNDCEQGTIQLKQCNVCKEWVYFVTSASELGSSVQHRYDTEVWRFDKDSHWHAVVCPHTEAGNKDVNGHAFFTYATVKWDGETSISEPTYEYWKECSVCGYKEKVVTKDSFTQGEDDIVHIKSISDWNAFATLVNSGIDTAGWKVQLDGDLDFKGGELIPIGMPTNAAKLVKLDDIGYTFDATQTIEGGFKGSFDGKGNIIHNFKIDGTHFVGIFACLNGGTVNDLKIENAKIWGDAFVGGVAGFITGESARITKVTSTDVLIDANRHIGGIAGYAYKAGPAISASSVDAVSQEAAIKECVVKGATNRNLLWVHTEDMAEDGYFWNGTNIGGILGTAIASSVIKCEVEHVTLYGIANNSYIVGYAEGLDASNKAVVVSNTAYDTECNNFNVRYVEDPERRPGVNGPVSLGRTNTAKVKANFRPDGTKKFPETFGKPLQKGQNTVDKDNQKNDVRPAGISMFAVALPKRDEN